MELIQPGGNGRELTKFERAVEVMDGIETIPAVAQRLVSLASDPDADFADIERLIASDAALTARVLRVASSTLYGGRPAQNLQAALIRLGLKEVRNLALTVSVVSKSADAFQRSLWRHTLATAVSAEILAKRLGAGKFREPFVCGLLHDLGSLVLAKLDGPPYHALVSEIGTEEQIRREQQVYGFNHCDLGALAAERWKLFDGLEQVIQFHHDPLPAERLAFPPHVLSTIFLVALAARVNRSLEGGCASETGQALLEHLGTDEETVAETLETAQSKMTDFLAALN